MAYIWEDEQLRDEPFGNNPDCQDPDDYVCYEHIYTRNLPETKDLVLSEFYSLIKEYSASDGYDRYM